MKKLLSLLFAAPLLFSCAADGDGNSTDPEPQGRVLTAVSSQAVNMPEGSRMIISSASKARQVASRAASITAKDVILICNEVLSTSNGQDAEGSFAVKNEMNAGFVTLGRDSVGGTLYVGDNFQGSYTKGGNVKGPEVVGDQWFNDQFAAYTSLIASVKATEPKTGYYLHTNGTPNLAYPYTYYEVDGITYVIAEWESYVQGSVDLDRDGKINWQGPEADVRVPWMEAVTGGWGETDAQGRAVANKYVLIPENPKKVLYLNGASCYGSILAPDYEIHATGAGDPTGLVVCNLWHTSGAANTEIHIPDDYTPPTPPTPGGDCDKSVDVDIDVDWEYEVQADDFAIHNGDQIYERIPSDMHSTLDKYVVVHDGGNIVITLEDICALYDYYKTKPGFISEEGILTVECWLWPGKVIPSETGDQIIPMTASELKVVTEEIAGETITKDCDENYLIGTKDNPALYVNRDYNVYVTAFKSIQGADKSSAIHVSFHISPKN